MYAIEIAYSEANMTLTARNNMFTIISGKFNSIRVKIKNLAFKNKNDSPGQK